MTGSEEYVWAANYDSRSRPSTLGIGPRPGGQAWMGRTYTYDDNQRLARMQTAIAGGDSVDHTFTYNKLGNITDRSTKQGTESWRECFGYDARQRLTSARTVQESATCSQGQSGTGDQPYQHTYRYSPDGRILERTEDGGMASYTYPTGANPDRPHAPTAVGNDSYTWDANGRLQQRTVDGKAETLTWDAEQRISEIAGPDGRESYVYGPDGERLLTTTPKGRTAYIGAHEVTASLDGTTVTAVRAYSFGDMAIASRTSGTGSVTYLVTDQQGSVEAAAAPGGTKLKTSRAYAPYGRQRSGGELDSARGWIGQVEDDTTQLSYLNARYYDPSIGVFLSPDPLMSLGQMRSINPYLYGWGDPINLTDKSGKYPDGLHPNTWRNYPYAVAWAIGMSGTPASRAASQRRAENNHRGYRAKAGTPAFKAVQKDIKKRTAELKAHDANVRTLKAMSAANPDPGFWFALSAAGGGDNLLNIARSISLNNKASETSACQGVGCGVGGGGGGSHNNCEGALDCAGTWAYHHTSYEVGWCVVYCVGVGYHAGTVYGESGVGCCYVGAGVQFTTRDGYDARQCQSFEASIPTPWGVGGNTSIGNEPGGGGLDLDDLGFGLGFGQGLGGSFKFSDDRGPMCSAGNSSAGSDSGGGGW